MRGVSNKHCLLTFFIWAVSPDILQFVLNIGGRGCRFKLLFILHCIFKEGDAFGMKAILPCGPLNIKHMKNKLYTYIQIANTNSAHCLSYRYYLKYLTINMFSCLCCIPETGNVTERQWTCVTPLFLTYSITYAQFT